MRALLPHLLLSSAALAAPVVDPWPSQSNAGTVAAAPVSGLYAAASTVTDSVQIRDIRGTLLREITRADILALLPWMNLDAGPDGPTAMTFTDSGRILYITVHDANPASSGASDAILAYDTQNNQLTVWGRLELSATDVLTTPLSLSFFRGKLLLSIGTVVVEYSAPSFASGTTLLAAGSLPAACTSLSVDREVGDLYALAGGTIYRASITGSTITFASVGTIAGASRLAWSDNFGTTTISNGGLYVAAGTQVWFIALAQARSAANFNPSLRTTLSTPPSGIMATPDGRFMIANAGASDSCQMLRDTSDPRLNFDGWLSDEFTQVVNFSRSLVTTGSHPGWVIDGDVQLGGTRFHPVTPDAAAWTVLLLIAQDRVSEATTGAPNATARALATQILARYAGRATDGLRPGRNADGIFLHWIDPNTGLTKSGWTDEWATMSTMKIALAASRAVDRWPFDRDIKASARAIIGGVHHWERYMNSANQNMYLTATSTGPNIGSASSGFHEGLLFVSEVGAYGAAPGPAIYSYWIDRSHWPTAAYVPGFPVTGQASNQFLASFTSLYCQLLIPEWRASSAWQTQMSNIRMNHMGWTDDVSPRFMTVFSAGTTAPAWGGYNADSLSYHPGDVTTFTSLEALSAGLAGGTPSKPDAVAAYNAYRRGGRQTFSGGASILYRRSDVTRTYQPDSAGMPDVGLGGLGLAEHLLPGLIDSVLALPHRQLNAMCDGDFNGDGSIDFFDYLDFIDAFTGAGVSADFNGDGSIDFFDYLDFVDAFTSGC